MWKQRGTWQGLCVLTLTLTRPVSHQPHDQETTAPPLGSRVRRCPSSGSTAPGFQPRWVPSWGSGLGTGLPWGKGSPSSPMGGARVPPLCRGGLATQLDRWPAPRRGAVWTHVSGRGAGPAVHLQPGPSRCGPLPPLFSSIPWHVVVTRHRATPKKVTGAFSQPQKTQVLPPLPGWGCRAHRPPPTQLPSRDRPAAAGVDVAPTGLPRCTSSDVTSQCPGVARLGVQKGLPLRVPEAAESLSFLSPQSPRKPKRKGATPDGPASSPGLILGLPPHPRPPAPRTDVLGAPWACRRTSHPRHIWT